MKTLEELKSVWVENQNHLSTSPAYDRPSLEKMFRSRVKKHTSASMRYFWASFTLQIIVYALLSNVIVKHLTDTEVLVLSIAGFALYVPFTIMLMKKFKSMATTKLIDHVQTSLHQYVLTHYTLLLAFYRFKTRYEFVLIPLSCAIGTILFFKLYMPGGVYGHLAGVSITFILAIVACAVAIRSENKKSFDLPLQQLRSTLDEFKREA
jgi:hypothetical protein